MSNITLSFTTFQFLEMITKRKNYTLDRKHMKGSRFGASLNIAKHIFIPVFSLFNRLSNLLAQNMHVLPYIVLDLILFYTRRVVHFHNLLLRKLNNVRNVFARDTVTLIYTIDTFTQLFVVKMVR